MQVFISHSSHNKDFASRLCNDLILYDIEVWFDEWSIRPGDSIPGAIETGLRESDYVLLLISRDAIKSNWVSEELNSTLYATLSANRPKLIPLLIERSPLPPMLQHRKHIDFANQDLYESSLNTLVAFLYQEFSPASPPQPIIPGFREIRLLGEGGFSTVYKAVESRTSDVKAIKIPKGRRRLDPEIAIAKKLAGHNGIVPIETAISYKDRVLLVMPYAGHSLKWFIEHKKIRPQQLQQIIVWMKTLLEVLVFAHSKHIIHRDIKPSNILIDEYGDLRIVDFGLAQKIQYAEFQQSTVVRGTLCYMSPEQQLAERVTQQSDIYSFGAVFYELVTGEKPVGRFRNPKYYNPNIPVQIEQIIEKCLERDLNDRYKTASDVLSDLADFSQLPSAPAPPPSRVISANNTMLIGNSAAIKEVLKSARLASNFSDPVLISGETGTGKELVARLVHEEYAKKMGDNSPFIAVNVAAIPDTLMESELFGHRKGAFFGASSDRKGLFERADGGTLFLDEVGQLSLSSQPRLLRVISEKEIVPIGGDHPIKVNVKIISATNQSLIEMVRNKEFRQDLFSRICSFQITLPPLRERKTDIPLLVRHFADRYTASGTAIGPMRFSKKAMELLTSYSWQGNVRELSNLVQICAISLKGSKDGSVSLDAIKSFLKNRESSYLARSADTKSSYLETPLTLDEARRSAEMNAIEFALKFTGRELDMAAQILEVSRTRLFELIKKYDL